MRVVIKVEWYTRRKEEDQEQNLGEHHKSRYMTGRETFHIRHENSDQTSKKI